jgi:hypothetical protein
VIKDGEEGKYLYGFAVHASLSSDLVSGFFGGLLVLSKGHFEDF